MKRISIFMLMLISGFLTKAQDATEIIRQMDLKMQGNSSRSDMTMKIIRPSWTREVGIKGWTLGTDYSLILITAPARDKGAAFLKRNEEMWNWQPTIDRSIKLPPSMMMQSWMGSDFTNDDLVKQSSIVKDYSHQIVGDTIIGDYDCYKIEMIPKEDAPVVWGKILTYVSKEEYLQMLVKFFDEDDYLVNTMVMSEIRNMGGRTIPTRMEVIPAENPDQMTVIIYKDIEFDIGLDENFFSIQNMKRVK